MTTWDDLYKKRKNKLPYWYSGEKIFTSKMSAILDSEDVQFNFMDNAFQNFDNTVIVDHTIYAKRLHQLRKKYKP